MPKMTAPQNGVTVRMYRPGHGDCFLLAFPRPEDSDNPIFVLIDCGYKPGSTSFIHNRPIGDVVKHIGESTDHHLDLVILTHEHEDHLNGIWKKKDPYFQGFTIDEAWLAWTEDPADKLADLLRIKHGDQLLGLISARQQLAMAVGETDSVVSRLDNILSLELGGEEDDFPALLAEAVDLSRRPNKQSMKLIKDKAGKKHTFYLRPGQHPILVPGSQQNNNIGIRVFVLGAPHDEDLLLQENPVGNEGFPEEPSAMGLSFFATIQDSVENRTTLFKDYQIVKKKALQRGFFRDHYGVEGDGEDDDDEIEAPNNASWRRIDSEWLYAAENLGLYMNKGINNTSLVLAFELPSSKKVLLFTGDAQRGNWISWDDQPLKDGNQTIQLHDLLARVVLYKVAHHGSHNATLSGRLDDNYPNLTWMSQGQFAGEFTAMITAVNKWALKKPKWVHPLPSIKKALEEKAQGRVFQTDMTELKKPESISDTVWDDFISRSKLDELYFDYTILDE